MYLYLRSNPNIKVKIIQWVVLSKRNPVTGEIEDFPCAIALDENGQIDTYGTDDLVSNPKFEDFE